MQHVIRGLALLTLAVVAIACSGGTTPTSAPASPAASPSSGASAPAGTGLSVIAKDLAFQPTALTAKADTAFIIDFDNQESLPHNIAIKDAAGAVPFKGDIVTATKITYNVPALAAGAYTFWCELHPNMTGTLTVQ
jgi:plastocyanin